ncbi:alpha/beta hydrolase [Streptomyces sp. NPDC015127]|uniref:alpha/beta hydrolase n=1 Tax=Streptomyces sp. NPDC015127 TaxID=3364939 RepID=UPI0036F9BE5C
MVSRLRRTLLAALVAAAVAVPVSAAARPSAVPAPAPAALAPLGAAELPVLDARYAATRAGIRAAARAADGHGDHRRARALRAMAADGRQFLAFDGRDGGRAAEVFGDLARADRVTVLVPGADTHLDTYARFRAGAAALHRALRSTGADRTAVVAWLGYATPRTLGTDALTSGLADEAAAELAAFAAELSAAKGDAVGLTLLCHSYGSVVCARAAGRPGTAGVSDIALFGSPGTGAETAAGLRTRATVWAGRGGDDWIADVPHVRLELLGTDVGFGTDPVADSFGARVFDAGGGGHSDYLRPGSTALRNLALIAAGRTAEVSRA